MSSPFERSLHNTIAIGPELRNIIIQKLTNYKKSRFFPSKSSNLG